ncbi:hypothetical protein OAO18_09190 [Francisellaceae bacterium]|nr:hypothetical protein [Francisellaceae bacterium]
MLSVSKRLVTKDDTSNNSTLPLNKLREWITRSIKNYYIMTGKSNKNKTHALDFIEIISPIFIDDVLTFKCESAKVKNGMNIEVNVIKDNLLLVKAKYIRTI